MSATKKVSTFELCDLGIYDPQCFNGFGVAFTPFSDCAYGIGDNPAEALDDCLEQIAMGYDIDVSDLETRIIAEWGKAPHTPSVIDEYGEDSEDCYYHIGIRWTVEE